MPESQDSKLIAKPRIVLYKAVRVSPQMEYVYAALLLHKLKKDVNEENVSSVIKASGADVNEAQVKSLIAALADVNIDEAVKAAPVAVAAPAPAGDAPEAKKDGGDAKADAKKNAKSEEQAIEGLSSLFG